MLTTRNYLVEKHTEIEDQTMAKLSQTSHALHTLFKPELDKRGAKQLLTYVLQPNEQNAAEIEKIAKTNPRLFFIKATAQDYAMDLAGSRRTLVDWSPYQALFGTSNKVLLLLVKPMLDAYLATLPDGFDMAASQEQEKFPDGFDFPPCSDEFNQLVDELELAITNDLQLKQDWRNASPATIALLAKFSRYYQPDIVRIGHHFNMNEMIKTYEIYDKNWNPWIGNQLTFLSVKMIGLQQRLLTGPYLDAACTGLKHMDNGQRLQGNFEINNYVTDNKISVVPFTNEDPTCRLGESFVINSYFGSGWGASNFPMQSSAFYFRKLCEENTAELSRLRHTAKQHSKTNSKCT